MKIYVAVILIVINSVTLAQTKSKTTFQKTIPPAVIKTELDSVSYALGASLANYYKQQGISGINTALASKAINDVMNGACLFSDQQINTSISNYFQKIKTEKMLKTKQEGQAFLESNKTKPGITTLPSGLQYQVLKEGSGAKPGPTDKVRCHYHGTLIDGTVFDSSVERGQPAEFPVNGVIKGWVEALQLMPVGSKWKLFIPSELAYGDRQAGPQILPGSALVFEVELLDIVK